MLPAVTHALKERPNMNKTLSTVGLALTFAMVSLLAGCQLYFGDHSGSGGSGGGGTGSGSSQPGGGSGSDQPPGYSCSTDNNCAAGCFCKSGVCTEAGFCATDKDCGTGFHCDTQRSSCVPIPAPSGLCRASVTCGTAAPACDVGQVPLVKDGCYTGACSAIAACEAAPACPAIQHEADCLGRTTDCSTVYTGIGCKKADGSACKSGDTGCTCDSFVFASCATRAAGGSQVIIE
jgi:hypothetical protein